ncbi:MAG: NADH-quinone oxidoreductase subunit J [Bdellovibrionales bacterium]|nr:NADH-quinone oxidoreductase subunit J [Bdellovibrionales bacterium]
MFYFFAILLLFSAIIVVSTKNSMTAILALTGTMIVQAFLFFLLKAYFLGAVQLIVYTGAVMVLFVMVIMIFNNDKEVFKIPEPPMSVWLKISAVAWFSGLVSGIFLISKNSLHLTLVTDSNFSNLLKDMSINGLSQVLFTKYLLAFEVMGVFLLAITVGVISIAKSRGGTHE